MIRVKRKRQKQRKFPFPLMLQAAMYFLQNEGRLQLTIFIRKYEMIEGFVCCQKFSCQPRKILEHVLGLGLYNKILWA